MLTSYSIVSVCFNYPDTIELQRILEESDNEELKRMSSGALWVLQGEGHSHSLHGKNQVLTSLTIQKDKVNDDDDKGSSYILKFSSISIILYCNILYL